MAKSKVRKKKVASNIPVDLLEEAATLSGLNQTQALIQGLRELIAERRRAAFLELEGKFPYLRWNGDRDRGRRKWPK